MNVPIIRLEFETMKETIRFAMTQQMARIDTDINAAIDRYCTSENLQALIDDTVRQSVNQAVKEEIQSLFRFNGHGRMAINDAIKKYADEMWGPLEPR